MLREATYPPAAVNVLDASSESMAAFQVFLYGRFWGFTEADVIRQSGFHSWRDAQCRVYATEIVVKEIQGDLMGMVLKFLTESVSQASVTPHPHSHREVATFHERRADVLRVRITTKNASTTTDARCGTIASLRTIARRPVQFDQHRVVNVSAESFLDGISVNTMAVGRKLNPGSDTGSNILHKRLRGR